MLGPPHPPSFKKIRIGVTSLPLKYSAICSVADGVTSTMTPSCRNDKMKSAHKSRSVILFTQYEWLKLNIGKIFVNDYQEVGTQDSGVGNSRISETLVG